MWRTSFSRGYDKPSMVLDSINADSVTYVCKAVASGLKKVFETDSDKIKNLFQVAYTFLTDDNPSEILAGSGALSYKQMVSAVNTCGEMLNAFINGLGNVTELEEQATKAYKGIIKSTDEDEIDFELYGICGIIKTVADCMQNLTTEFATGIYLDYDDYSKAKTDAEEKEKLGYIAAKVGAYVGKYYALNTKSEEFINVMCDLIADITIDFTKVKDITKKCAEKSADQMTAEERTALTAQVEGIICSSDKLTVYSWGTAFVPVGTDVATIKEMLHFNAYGVSQVDEDDVTVSCDTSKEGFLTVTYEYEGKTAETSTNIYVYSNATAGKFEVFGDTIMLISVSTDETLTADDVMERLDQVSSWWNAVWVYHKETQRHISSVVLDEADTDGIELIGFDNRVSGKRVGVIKFKNHKYLGDVYVPFVYFVYEETGEKEVTSVDVRVDSYKIIQGNDISGFVAIEYNYGESDTEVMTFPGTGVKIEGYNKDTVGPQTVKISVTVNGKEYSDTVFVEVISPTQVGVDYVYAEFYADIWDKVDYDNTCDIYTFTIGADIDQMPIYVYMEFGSIEINGILTVAEIRNAVAQYGYEIQHNIVTSSEKTSSQSGSIWLQKGNRKTTVIEFDYKVEDKTNDDSSVLEEEVSRLILSFNPYLETFKNVRADSSFGIDVSANAYVMANDAKNELELKLAANLNAYNPQFAVGLLANGNDIFGLGYSDANIYLTECLNMLNTSATVANKIKMNVDYFRDGINNVASVWMQYFEWFAQNTLVDIDLAKVNDALKGADGNINMYEAFDGLISASGTENGATFFISAENMRNILNMVFSVFLDYYTDEIDKTLMGIGAYAARLFPEYEDVLLNLSIDTIINEYCPALKIKASYEGDVIKSIDVALIFDSLNLEFGLGLDFNIVSLTERANISFSGYKAQDIKGSVKIDLDNKGLSGVIDYVIHTSDAFAAKDNNIISAKLKINDVEEAAVMAFNGETLYFDITNAFYALDAVNVPSATVFADYIKEYDEREGQMKAVNIKTQILNALKDIRYCEPEPGYPVENAPSTKNISDWGIIYNLINNGFGGTADTTYEDVIELLDEKIGDYLKFDIVDSNGNALPLGSIYENIYNIYRYNRYILDNAINESSTEIGVQIFKCEEASLLKFISKFIRIPAINDYYDRIEIDPYSYAEIDGAYTLKKYVEYIFAQYPFDGQYADYFNTGLIYRIFGVGYENMIDSGIYVYAGYNAGEGLDGYVGIKADKYATDSYIEIGGKVGFVQSVGSFVAIPSDLSGTTDFTEITVGKTEENEGDKDYYVIDGTLWALVDAFLAYHN